MWDIARHVAIDDLRGWHVVEFGLGIFVFQDLVREADIERTAAERNSRRQGQALDDGLNHLVPVLLHNLPAGFHIAVWRRACRVPGKWRGATKASLMRLRFASSSAIGSGRAGPTGPRNPCRSLFSSP
jgi:hypothetical protein